MIASVKNRIVEKYLRQAPGTKSFFKNLSIISAAFLISKVFSTVANVLAARYFGKEIFGQLSLTMQVATFSMMVMMGGLNSAVMRYGAGKEDPSREISTAFYMSLLYSAVVMLLTFLLSDVIIGFLPSVSKSMLVWGSVFGLGMTVYTLLTAFTQTVHRFKVRGVAEIIFGALLLPGFYLGYLIAGKDSTSLVIAYITCYIITGGWIAYKLGNKLKPNLLPRVERNSMLKYGMLSVFTCISYIMTFVVQPFQIDYYRGAGDAGVFRVYSMASIMIAGYLSSMIQTVFFPKISASNNKLGIWKRTISAWIKIMPLLLVFYGVITWLSVLLSGKHEYPVNLSWIMIFAVASTLLTVMNSFGQLITVEGHKGMTWGILTSAFSGLVNFTATAWLVPKYGVGGAGAALAVNYFLTISALFFVKGIVYKNARPVPNA